jgi:integrase
MARHFFITYKIYIEKEDIKAVSLYVGHQEIGTTLKMYVDTSLDSKTSQIKI